MNRYVQIVPLKQKGIKYSSISKKHPLQIQIYSPPKINIYQKPQKPFYINNYKKTKVSKLNNNDSSLKRHKINYQNYLSNCKKSAYCVLASNLSNMKRNKAKQHCEYNLVDNEKRPLSLSKKRKNSNVKKNCNGKSNAPVKNEEMMKQIKNTLDDNLKVMFNFSYENFLSKESESESKKSSQQEIIITESYD